MGTNHLNEAQFFASDLEILSLGPSAYICFSVGFLG